MRDPESAPKMADELTSQPAAANASAEASEPVEFETACGTDPEAAAEEEMALATEEVAAAQSELQPLTKEALIDAAKQRPRPQTLQSLTTKNSKHFLHRFARRKLNTQPVLKPNAPPTSSAKKK